MPRSWLKMTALTTAIGIGTMTGACSDDGETLKPGAEAPVRAETPLDAEHPAPAAAKGPPGPPGAFETPAVGAGEQSAPSPEAPASESEAAASGSRSSTPALIFPWSDAKTGEWASYRLEGGAVQQWVVLEVGTRKALLRVRTQYAAGALELQGPVFERTVLAQDDPFPHPSRAATESAVVVETVTLEAGPVLDCVRVVEGETVTWWSPNAPCDGVVRRVQDGVLVRELVNFTAAPPPDSENGR